MSLLNKIQYIRAAAGAARRIYSILTNPKYENNRHLGEIIRNTHSLEKGLSLENVRMGFGLAKIKESRTHILAYKNNGGDMSSEPLVMFIDALNTYLSYHKEKNFNNDAVREATDIYNELSSIIQSVDGSYGGVMHVYRNGFSDSEIATIERLFNDRHSMREFDHTPVDESKLRKAIELAMRCPSACNRQCYRMHIVDKKDFAVLNNWFDGTGGFAEDLDKMIFISGKMSVYRPGEIHQWIVTGSIFASYLTLSLEAYGIGCCFIQRPVTPSSNWDIIAKKIGAAGDEMLICCMGIGNMKNEYTVPISHRLNYDIVVNRVKL